MNRPSVKRLIGVGVGPGDPELVTVKAVRVLRESDVVLVPVLAGSGSEPGRAETIIRAHVAADRVRRLEFALNDTGGVTPRRAAAWQAAAAAVAEAFAAGAASVAFGTLGDPNLYSTFSYLARAVRELVPEVTVETVAGITAMQDLASRAGLSLAEGTEPVTLVPLNGGAGPLEQALARGGTVVGYKVGAAASPAPAVLRDRLQAAWPPRLRRHRRPPGPPRRANRPRGRPPPPPTPNGHSGYSVFVHPDRPGSPDARHRRRPHRAPRCSRSGPPQCDIVAVEAPPKYQGPATKNPSP